MSTHTYADFSGGWYGTLDPAKSPDNMFDSRNMILYRDGAIGPRPGLRLFNLGRQVVEDVYAIDTRRNISIPSETVLLYIEGTGSEVQSITYGGSGLTSYTLTYSGQTTASIAAAATAAQIQSALEALSNIAVGDVHVQMISATVFYVYFDGALANTNVAQMTSTPTGGTGTVTIATLRAGGAGTAELYGVEDDNSGTIPTGYPWTIANQIVKPAAGFPINMYHKTNFRTFIHVPGASGGLWRFQQGIIAALDTSSGTRVGTTSGVRVLRDEDGTLNLFYSDPSDPTTWGALSFISIAEDPGASIVNISELNNYVVIVTDYGGWFMLSGVPGVNDVLRQVYQELIYPSPYGMRAFVTTSENELFALSPADNCPVMFNGTKLERLGYLSMTPTGGESASYANAYDVTHKSVVAFLCGDTNSPAFILPDPKNLLLTKQNGAWGLHEFGVDVSEVWCGNGERIYGFTSVGATAPVEPGNGQVAVVADFGLDRPAFTNDTFAQPGDLSDTPFEAYITLPEKWTETSDPVTVSEVVVDFVKYDTGIAGGNHFKVTVESLARAGAGVTDGSQVKEWNEAGATASTLGTPDRARLSFGNQSAGAGYRVTVSEIRGVKIREIVVHDSDDNRSLRPF